MIVWEAKAILRGLLSLEKPLIGRINGHAMGLGATLAVFCDITFMVKQAKIANIADTLKPARTPKNKFKNIL